VIEGGHELPRRQIATGAENDDGARFYRLATSIQATGQQVVELCGLIHAQTIVEGQPVFKYSMWRAGIPIPGGKRNLLQLLHFRHFNAARIVYHPKQLGRH
jgi:hypothetical protein